jgi:hypothetical protein
MILADFQKKAVDSLTKSFLTLWQTNNYQLPLVFKAPTGAGKTIMMAEFLRTLDGNYHFDDDKAYIWISFGGDDSYLQSKEKLYKYFNNGTDMTLRDKNDLSLKELPKNNIFFINWSKIKSSTKDGKVLRKESELTSGDYGVFDEFIINTKNKRDLILIIDEAHTETSTNLAQEVIDLINPRIIIKVTAPFIVWGQPPAARAGAGAIANPASRLSALPGRSAPAAPHAVRAAGRAGAAAQPPRDRRPARLGRVARAGDGQPWPAGVSGPALWSGVYRPAAAARLGGGRRTAARQHQHHPAASISGVLPMAAR